MTENKDFHQLRVERNNKKKTVQELNLETTQSTHASKNILEQVKIVNPRNHLWRLFRKIFVTLPELEYHEAVQRGWKLPEVNQKYVEKEKRENIKTYFKVWEALKKAGLPTLPTLRKAEDLSLIMTDLTAQGGRFYSAHDHRDGTSDIDMIDPVNDPTFAELDLSDSSPTAQLLEQYSQQAAEHAILFAPDDALQLLVENGEAYPIFLDLEQIELNPRHTGGKFVGRDMTTEEVAAMNSYRAANTLEELRTKQTDIRTLLAKRQ